MYVIGVGFRYNQDYYQGWRNHPNFSWHQVEPSRNSYKQQTYEESSMGEYANQARVPQLSSQQWMNQTLEKWLRDIEQVYLHYSSSVPKHHQS